MKAFSGKSTFFAIIMAGLLALPVAAQITPHSTLKNFKLPKYNENSYRAYTLSGREGIYDTEGFFEVNMVKLSLYSGDESQILETTITSPLAIFDLEKDLASGKSVVEITDKDFYLRGEDWSLDMNHKNIKIKNGGWIRFYNELDLDISGVF